MRIEDYNQLIIDFRAKGDTQANQKRIEYTESKGNEDVLANFKATAEDLNLDALQVLGIFMKKHWSSIINYIKTGKVHSEPIHGRIMDLIQYLELTHACIIEKELEQIDHRVHDAIDVADPKNDDLFNVQDRLVDPIPTSDLPQDRLYPKVINKDTVRKGIQNDMEC